MLQLNSSGRISIFDVLSYFSLYDWPGENHTDEITELFGEITESFDEITELFLLWNNWVIWWNNWVISPAKTKNKTEKSKSEIPQI